MTKKMKMGASSFWVIIMTLGILGCLGGVFYTFYLMQQESGQEGEYRLAANQMRLLTQQVAADARATEQGEAETFDELKSSVGGFTMELGQMLSLIHI